MSSLSSSEEKEITQEEAEELLRQVREAEEDSEGESEEEDDDDDSFYDESEEEVEERAFSGRVEIAHVYGEQRVVDISVRVSEHAIKVIDPQWEEKEGGQQLMRLVGQTFRHLKEMSKLSTTIFFVPHHTLRPSLMGPPSGCVIAQQINKSLLEQVPVFSDLMHMDDMFQTLAVTALPRPEECGNATMMIYNTFEGKGPLTEERYPDQLLRDIYEKVKLRSPAGFFQVLCTRDRLNGHKMRLYFAIFDNDPLLSNRFFEHARHGQVVGRGVFKTFFSRDTHISGAPMQQVTNPSDHGLSLPFCNDLEIKNMPLNVETMRTLARRRAAHQMEAMAECWGITPNALKPPRTFITNYPDFDDGMQTLYYVSGVVFCKAATTVPLIERPDSSIFFIHGALEDGGVWSPAQVPFFYTFPLFIGDKMEDHKITQAEIDACPSYVCQYLPPEDWDERCVRARPPCAAPARFKHRSSAARLYEAQVYDRKDSPEERLDVLFCCFNNESKEADLPL